MNRTIHKYGLKITDEQFITLPLNAEILDAQPQSGDIYLWALIDENQPIKEERKICIVGTGHEIKHNVMFHISTFQLVSERLVLHVFEVLT